MTQQIKQPGQTAIDQRDQTSLFLHLAIWSRDGTLLDGNWFQLYSFNGQEQISQPFRYQLELRANTAYPSGNPLSFEQVIGQPVTVGINLPSAQDQGMKRFTQALSQGQAEGMTLFNGIITDFALSEPGVYQLTMQPALFRLTLSNHYRVLKNLTISEVVQQILREHAIIDLDLSGLSGTDNPALNRRQDWLQAGESDYEFLQRMMGKAQLFYYFLHSGRKHTLVFSNHAGFPAVYPSGHKLRYTSTSVEALGREQEDLITRYQYQQSLTSSSVNAVFTVPQSASQECTVADYASYRTVAPEPIGSDSSRSMRSKGALPFHLYRIYPYGGSEQEVGVHARETAAMAASGGTRLSGESHCPMFRIGHQFSMTQPVVEGVEPELIQPSLESSAFVLTSVKHQCTQQGQYSNEFEATECDSSTLVTPFALNDTHQGSIIGQVVAHGSGVAPNDWRYYNRNAYSPNRFSVTDSLATPSNTRFEGVYVKLSTDGPQDDPVWVRLAPHMQTVPEINALVTVSRSNDQGELPEIQSIIQNNGTMVVTPCEWTANSHLGNSYSTSFSDSKSIRLPYADTGAQLDSYRTEVEARYQNGATLTGDFPGQVFRDVSYSVGGSWSTNKAVNGRDGILSESYSEGCSYSKSEAKENRSWSNIDLAWSDSKHKNVKSWTTITGEQYSKSTVGVARSINTTDHSLSDNKTGTSTSSSLTGLSTHSSVTGMSTASNITGVNNSLNMTGMNNGVNMVGMANELGLTGLSLGRSMTGASLHINATGTAVSAASTGTSVNASLTGISSSQNITGLSSNTNVTGISSATSVEGVSSTTAVHGVESRTSVTGVSTSVSVTGVDNTTTVIGSGTIASVDNRTEAKVTADRLQIRAPGLKSNIMVGIYVVL